jgi:hypothetical protein
MGITSAALAGIYFGLGTVAKIKDNNAKEK